MPKENSTLHYPMQGHTTTDYKVSLTINQGQQHFQTTLLNTEEEEYSQRLNSLITIKQYDTQVDSKHKNRHDLILTAQHEYQPQKITHNTYNKRGQIQSRPYETKQCPWHRWFYS